VISALADRDIERLRSAVIERVEEDRSMVLLAGPAGRRGELLRLLRTCRILSEESSDGTVRIRVAVPPAVRRRAVQRGFEVLER
jgi:50S ribosomal subunit-associated GTPase HflX